jgi:preprotein translocase SecF subunit
MRLKLVRENTNFDFFGRWKLWLGISALMMMIAFGSYLYQGLNFGIDFRGGTSIRTESTQPVDIATYRDTLATLDLGDISITEVFDPTFRDDQNIAMIRIQAQDGQEAVTIETIGRIEQSMGLEFGGDIYADFLIGKDESSGVFGDKVAKLSILFDKTESSIPKAETETAIPKTKGVRFTFPSTTDAAIFDTIKNYATQTDVKKDAFISFETIKFPSVESVGPKVSGELIKTAALAVVLAIGAVLIYIWLRFEWQFALGAVAALLHDVILTIGVFAALQIKFDLAIIAALLTIVGYSLNDTVVVFDRVRENLRKYKKKPLAEVLNISINETLSRTVMTSVTTLLALISLFVLGGDVIRGFVFAMIWGVIVGTYSSVFVASSILLYLGVKRDWSKIDPKASGQYANIDA